MYDVLIIGGGPGGYVAAIRAAQLGLKVACIEKRGSLGGTCLNVGCIPSKALLHSSHLYEEAQHEFSSHGIEIKSLALNLPKMLQRKESLVRALTKGVEGLLKKNKVDYFKGMGVFKSKHHVSIVGESPQDIEAKSIIIATGSDVGKIANIDIDEKRIVSSTGALNLSEVPQKMIVIGAGVIGLELGSVWSRLGAQVKVIEFGKVVLPSLDGEIQEQTQKILEKQGFSFLMEHKVGKVTEKGSELCVFAEHVKSGETMEFKADVVLVSTGRVPYTEGLNLKNIGVNVDERGFICVEKNFATSVPNIYAIGDVIGGSMLAHKAEEEGIAVVESLVKSGGHVNYDAIPSVVYISPEIASVGQTEEQLKGKNIEYVVGKFPFMANSRAKTNGQKEGFVKILAHKKTDKILGAHIIGPAAGELIAEIVLGMEFSACAEDIFRTCHSHPGYGEAVKEAALMVHKRAIHI